MTALVRFRTVRDVRFESGMRAKRDVLAAGLIAGMATGAPVPATLAAPAALASSHVFVGA